MNEHNVTITREPDLVEVRNLVKYYPVRSGIRQRITNWNRAVDDVSFSIKAGETLGLVGESGCGKTTIGHTILRLLEPDSGSIHFDGINVLSLHGSELKSMRRNMQIIFQDPFSSLDPRKRVGESIAEGLHIHKVGTPSERRDFVLELLQKVGLKDYHYTRLPHEFSSGQRQRIGVSRALALRPKFIVADEPVSALDVSIQAQVLNLLKSLQNEFHLTYLFIAHNMSVIEHVSDIVAVMYLGKIMEIAPTQELFDNPLHPYTIALLSAVPIPNPQVRKERILLPGDVPSPLNPPSGCRFHPRCPQAMQDICPIEEPKHMELKSGHCVACWLHA
jgi:peptide/nickel transport system ATP-binding protein/oligopeptide transport system ATP-binding protein